MNFKVKLFLFVLLISLLSSCKQTDEGANLENTSTTPSPTSAPTQAPLENTSTTPVPTEAPLVNTYTTPVPTQTPDVDAYWIYDAESEFSSAELYMMLSANDSCSQKKHISTRTNPSHVPVLKDFYAQNNKVLDVYFPGCQWDDAQNFSMKSMAQPMHGKQQQFPLGSDIWQAFSVYVPSNYSHSPDWNLIYQYHAHPDDVGVCDNWRSPPTAIAMTNSGTEWLVNLRYSDIKCQKSNGEAAFLRLDGQPIVKGGWTHFVIHLRYDWRGDGQAEVWITDDQNTTPVKIADYSGPLGYNDDLQPYDYVSFGYYYGNSPGPDVQLYFDRIIFAGSGGSLEALMYNPDP